MQLRPQTPVVRDLIKEWKWGSIRWPFFDTDLATLVEKIKWFLMQTRLRLKTKIESIKARSRPASLSFIDLVTERTTVKWLTENVVRRNLEVVFGFWALQPKREAWARARSRWHFGVVDVMEYSANTIGWEGVNWYQTESHTFHNFVPLSSSAETKLVIKIL